MNENEGGLYELKLTLEGELMEGGSVEYKTLFGVVDGTATSIERLSKLSGFDRPVTFYVTPPKEKCFEITLQIKEWLGALVPLLSAQAPTVKDLVSILVEYLKIKKSLKGEELTRDKIQTNDNGQTIIKSSGGEITYVDNRHIVNQNIIVTAAEDKNLNKKIDKIVASLEASTRVDKLILGEDAEEVSITKEEAVFFKYDEKIEERPESIVGTIRQINNRTNKGIVVIQDEESEHAVNFELDIKDLTLLESTVRNLAIAEGTGRRVVFVGERHVDREGRLKKIIVNTVEIADTSFDF